MPATRYYREKAHLRALEVHNERWKDMHSIRLARGIDNEDYRLARQDVIDAVRAVRFEARKPRKPRSVSPPKRNRD